MVNSYREGRVTLPPSPLACEVRLSAIGLVVAGALARDYRDGGPGVYGYGIGMLSRPYWILNHGAIRPELEKFEVAGWVTRSVLTNEDGIRPKQMFKLTEEGYEKTRRLLEYVNAIMNDGLTPGSEPQ